MHDVPTAKEKFLAELQHNDKHHTAEIDTARGQEAWSLAQIRRASSAQRVSWPEMPARCGWWFCCEPIQGAVDWRELTEAGLLLRKRGRDPWSLEAAQIAYQVGLTDGWAAERDGYEKLLSAILAADVDGDAQRLQKKFLNELNPRVLNARSVKPERSGPTGQTKPGPRAALMFAEQLGWSDEEVAAILVLAGVDRGKLAAVTKKIRQMHERMRIALVRD